MQDLTNHPLWYMSDQSLLDELHKYKKAKWISLFLSSIMLLKSHRLLRCLRM